jgi:hypothetical protein
LGLISGMRQSIHRAAVNAVPLRNPSLVFAVSSSKRILSVRLARGRVKRSASFRLRIRLPA